jgi:hypothetical protein
MDENLVPVAAYNGVEAHMGTHEMVLIAFDEAQWTISDFTIVAMATMGKGWKSFPLKRYDTPVGEMYVFTLPTVNRTQHRSGGVNNGNND